MITTNIERATPIYLSTVYFVFNNPIIVSTELPHSIKIAIKNDVLNVLVLCGGKARASTVAN